MNNNGLLAVKEFLTPYGIADFQPIQIPEGVSARYLTIGLGELSTAFALNFLEDGGFMKNDLPRDLGGAAMYRPSFVVVPSGEEGTVTLEDTNHYNHPITHPFHPRYGLK